MSETQNPPPPYSPEAKRKLSQIVLNALSGSQQQAIIGEISELVTEVKFSFDAFDQLYRYMIKEDTEINTSDHLKPQAEDWFESFSAYKQQIGVIKRALSAVLNDPITRFGPRYVNMAHEDTDEDVITEFEGFSEDLTTKYKEPVVDFSQTRNDIADAKQNFNSKLQAIQAHEPEITATHERIAKLQERLERALETIKRIVPERYKDMGVDGRTPKIALFLSAAPRSLVKILMDAFKGEFEEAKAALRESNELWDAASEVENCDENIATLKKKLAGLLHQQEAHKSDQARWNICVSVLQSLEASLSNITPKLSSVSKIAAAVKGDIDEYLLHMRGPERGDKQKHAQALENLDIANALYETLKPALSSFITLK